MQVKTPLQQRVDAITADAQQAATLARCAVNEVRRALLKAPGIWWRQCFICEFAGRCKHREPELIERWESGLTR